MGDFLDLTWNVVTGQQKNMVKSPHRETNACGSGSPIANPPWHERSWLHTHRPSRVRGLCQRSAKSTMRVKLVCLLFLLELSLQSAHAQGTVPTFAHSA